MKSDVKIEVANSIHGFAIAQLLRNTLISYGCIVEVETIGDYNSDLDIIQHLRNKKVKITVSQMPRDKLATN